jgi:hypothetical protein
MLKVTPEKASAVWTPVVFPRVNLSVWVCTGGPLQCSWDCVVASLALLARGSDSPRSECSHLLRRTLCAWSGAAAQGKREVCRADGPGESLGGFQLWHLLRHFHPSLTPSPWQQRLWGTPQNAGPDPAAPPSMSFTPRMSLSLRSPYDLSHITPASHHPMVITDSAIIQALILCFLNRPHSLLALTSRSSPFSFPLPESSA